MNTELERVAKEANLSGEANERLRLAFGLACAQRVRHLLEDDRAVAAVDALRSYIAGTLERPALDAVAAQMREVAQTHRGSRSLDGAGHAAVSATYAVAQALNGQALQAADYAAYAAVYNYSGHAITDPSAFTEEFNWQVARLRELCA